MDSNKFGRFVAGNTVDIFFNPLYYVKNALLDSKVTSGTTTDALEFWTSDSITVADGDIVVCNQFGGVYRSDVADHYIDVTKDTFPDGISEWQKKFYTELFIFDQSSTFGVFRDCFISSVSQNTKYATYDLPEVPYSAKEKYVITAIIRDEGYDEGKSINTWDKVQQLLMSPVVGVSSCDDNEQTSYTYADDYFRKTKYEGASYNPIHRMGVLETNSAKRKNRRNYITVKIELYG